MAFLARSLQLLWQRCMIEEHSDLNRLGAPRGLTKIPQGRTKTSTNWVPDLTLCLSRTSQIVTCGGIVGAPVESRSTMKHGTASGVAHWILVETSLLYNS